MPIQIYVMSDDRSGSTPAIQSTLENAKRANLDRMGVFWTVNSFRGPRKIDNLERINSWAVDLDEGTKEEQRVKIKAGLVPSLVVETKRGYQVYFKAKNARPEHWNSIVLDRLVPFYGADPRARDLARIMRLPGFLHWKDPNDPFLVTEVFRYPVSYTEQQMASFYRDESKEVRTEFKKKLQSEFKSESEDLWEAIWRMDCMEGLEQLSGDPAVGSEIYTFSRNANGNHNILVNGKGTSCWIDRDGRIGSLDKGGPTLWQWINWFHKSNKKTAEEMKRIFPWLPWTRSK